ncbi:MAG: GntR family transcriptional regulator [Oscillospiraceae bacterium]|nr:GntR family transcriptional regulator [Oscillospiraceae bacterium]
MFDIDVRSRVPVYEQLCKSVAELAAKGVLRPGDKLPSVREESKALGINPNTVTKAYAALERDGIVYSVPGRGVFLADSHDEVIKAAARERFSDAVDDALKAGLTSDELKDIIDEGEGKNDQT